MFPEKILGKDILFVLGAASEIKALSNHPSPSVNIARVEAL
jgi:hypothetical protein